MANTQTIKETNPEAYAQLEGLYDFAITQLTEPDFVKVAPPPDNKAPYYLINSWGMEMLRIGIEIGLAFADDEKD